MMNKVHCLLVDDEPPAIELLEKYIDMIDHLEIVGKSQSAVKAFNLLKSTNVDLIFLDIQMPVLNGINFIKTLKSPPAIILTTAYREYAMDGYDLDIVDYLLKPISFDRFLKAVDRFRHRNSMPQAQQEGSEENSPSHIYFNVNRTKHKVVFDEISHIESLKDYVRIHLLHNSLVVKGNIGSILKLLPADKFVRIHRSYIVPLRKIRTYHKGSLSVNDISLPIGAKYWDDLLKRIS